MLSHLSREFPVPNKAVAERFRALKPAEPTAYLTYVWIDGTGELLRSKTKCSREVPKSISEVAPWSYDGSSCYQAKTGDSDLELRAVRLVPDPFMPSGAGVLVLCDVYDGNGNPHTTNRRVSAAASATRCADLHPMFGFEQEYTLMGADGRPYGFPSSGLPRAQGPFYCSAGAESALGRDVCDAHLHAAQFAGLNLWGTNGEVMPGQWEYQTSPEVGVRAADTLWLSRYLLYRVGEEFGIGVSLDPKPAPGAAWNGAGCHTNFSTAATLDPATGMDAINDAIARLEKRHALHIRGYDPSGGRDNARRLTGACETASIEKFSSGAAARSASVRIPRAVFTDKCGYLEDRRPAANMDPYRVVDLLMRTVCLKEEGDTAC